VTSERWKKAKYWGATLQSGPKMGSVPEEVESKKGLGDGVTVKASEHRYG